jgi:hypothetical protein
LESILMASKTVPLIAAAEEERQRREIAEAVEFVQNLLVSQAEGTYRPGTSEYREANATYDGLRDLLLAHPETAHRVPRFVRTCRDLRQFWGYVKGQSDRYAGRREHIWAEFRPVLDALEGVGATPPLLPERPAPADRAEPADGSGDEASPRRLHLGGRGGRGAPQQAGRRAREGKQQAKHSPAHAELAVNLAGAMTLVLVQMAQAQDA